jgi:hypothetical protein
MSTLIWLGEWSGGGALWMGTVLLKGVLVLLATAAVTRLLAPTSAAFRHLACGLGLTACLGIMASALALPPWSVASLPLLGMLPAGAPATEVAIGSAGTALSGGQPLAGAAGPWSWGGAAFALWALGAAVLLASAARDLWTARQLVRRSRPVHAGRLHDLIVTLDASGHPPALRTSREVSGPVTTGLLRTTIIVPPEAEQWSEIDQRAVLSHELAHVARRDCLTQLMARVARALHWPNPLVWWAERRMRAEREMAADDAALGAGSKPSDYARFLLGLASTLRGRGQSPAAALAMAGPSALGERLERLLDPARSRRTISMAMAALTLMGALGVAVPLGCLGGGASTTAVSQPPLPASQSRLWVAVHDPQSAGARKLAADGAADPDARTLGIRVESITWRAGDPPREIGSSVLVGPGNVLRQYLSSGRVTVTPPDRILVEDLAEGRAQALVVNEDTFLGLPPARVSMGRDVAGRPSLNLEFAPDIAEQLATLTAASIGHKMVLMSGDRMLASPVVKSAFGNRVHITLGDKAPPGEAEALAASLRESLHPRAVNPAR